MRGVVRQALLSFAYAVSGGVPREGAPTGGGGGWFESLLIEIDAFAGVELDVLCLRWGVAQSVRNWTGVLIPMSNKSPQAGAR